MVGGGFAARFRPRGTTPRRFAPCPLPRAFGPETGPKVSRSRPSSRFTGVRRFATYPVQQLAGARSVPALLRRTGAQAPRAGCATGQRHTKPDRFLDAGRGDTAHQADQHARPLWHDPKLTLLGREVV